MEIVRNNLKGHKIDFEGAAWSRPNWLAVMSEIFFRSKIRNNTIFLEKYSIFRCLIEKYNKKKLLKNSIKN